MGEIQFQAGDVVPNDGPHRVRFYRTRQYRLVRGPISPEDNLHYAELEGVTTPTDERHEQPIWVLRWSSPQGEWEEITPGEAVAMLLDVVWPNLTMEGFDVDLATKFVNRLLATEPHPCPYKKGDELIWTPGPDSDVQPVVFVSQNGDEPEYANVTMDGQNGQVRLSELSRDNGDDGEQPEPAPTDDGPRTLERLCDMLGISEDFAVLRELEGGRYYRLTVSLRLVKGERGLSGDRFVFTRTTRQETIDAAWDALHPARQRHQDGPFKFGQPVESDNQPDEVLEFCCVIPNEPDKAIVIGEYAVAYTFNLSDLRPVPAPKEYTKEDLPEIEGVTWKHDFGDAGLQRYVGYDDHSGIPSIIGRWKPTESAAVRDILERIGRPFAEAAGKEGE